MRYFCLNTFFVVALLFSSQFTSGWAQIAAFDTFVTSFWSWQQSQIPDYYSTYSGLDYSSDDIEQYSQQAFLTRRNQASALLDDLLALDRTPLDEQRQLSYDVLVNSLTAIVDGYRWIKYGPLNPFNPLESPLMRWKSLITASMRIQSESRVRKVINWYNDLPQQLNDIIANMNTSIEEHTTNHIASMTGVQDKLDEELALGLEDSSFMAPFHWDHLSQIEGIDNATRVDLRDQGLALVRERVIPALQELRDYMVNVYFHNLRVEPGVGSLPGGQQYYLACLRWFLSTDDTARDVHNLGLQEVTRILAEMDKERIAYGFDGTVKNFILHLRAQDQYYYDNVDDLLQRYRDLIDINHGRMHKLLAYVTELPVEVASNSNPQSAGGSYSGPPLDRSRNATFWVNTADLRARPKFDMVALTMHEAEPGHHTQISYLVESEDFPLFRRVQPEIYYAAPFGMPQYTATVEGWALYAEDIADEIGAYDEPLTKLGKLNSEMFRACRLVVDTGMHSLGWSKDKALEFMFNYTSRSDSSVHNEINRYISWPGQACAYKIGQIKIRGIRQKAEAQLGCKFDKRQFHHEILKLGPLPMSTLESRLGTWMDRVGADPGVTCPADPTDPSTSPSLRPALGSIAPALTWALIVALKTRSG